MKGLNADQRRAVETLKGPLLVLAGAGSGKTRVVTMRIARLIRSGVPPERILGVTFTNKAASEMQERVAGVLRKRQPEQPRIATFHAHCLQVLRRHIERLDYPPRFAIYGRGDQEGVAAAALREIRAPETSLRPGDLLYQISRWKSSSLTPDQAARVARTDKEHLAAAAYRRYQEKLRTSGAVDFDDLLMCTEELFARFPAVRREEADRFDHLLVDEYQDTNGAQYRILRYLAAGHRNLCVVGDDDQAIYGWRGAEARHILNFQQDWPDATVVRLQHNYRSTAAILEAANRLIEHNRTRHPKQLIASRGQGRQPRVEQFPSGEDEAQGVVRSITSLLREPGIDPGDVAILFRTNEQPRLFETELRRAGLPYVLLGSRSFFDRVEVREVLTYLRALDYPGDELALRRIINVPARGIGEATVRKLSAAARDQEHSFWKEIQQPSVALAAAQRCQLEAFTSVMKEYRARLRREPLADALCSLFDRIRYREEVRRRHPEPEDDESCWASVEEIVNAVGDYSARVPKPTAGGFLDECRLNQSEFGDGNEKKLQQNAIALITYHSAKGLEFPHVFMVGMEQGILPHRRSVEAGRAEIEEERRLCYVGVTRAQESLTLTLALARRKWGKLRPTEVSQFLYELTGLRRRPERKRPAPAR